MKKVLNTFLAIATVFLLLGGVTVQAQLIDFEDKTIGDPIAAIGWGEMVAEIAVDPLAAGNKVLKFTPNNYNAAPVLEVTLPAGKTLADYSTFKFKGYFAQGDVGWKDIIVEAYQTLPTGQAYKNEAAKIGSWNRAKGGSTAWEDISISISGSSSLTGTIYLAFGINCAGTGDIGGSGLTTIWYADNIQLVLSPLVTQWGKAPGREFWPVGNDSNTVAGEAILGDGTNTSSGGWASIRGSFEPLDVSGSIVVVSGKLELIGGGAGSDYTFMRYALGFTDSLKLVDQYTDSARWVSVADSAKNANKTNGYLFTPVSGTGTMSNSWRGENGGAGTVWRVNYGDWVSTNNPNSPQIAAVRQAPRNAEMVAGVYKWAISIQDMGDGTNEVRWYMVEENDAYWFGGTVIDEAQITNKVNGVMFGFNGGEYTRVDFWNVKIDKGEPITVPEAPWQAFAFDKWGKAPGREFWPVGNDSNTVAGEAILGDGTNTSSGGWASIRGSFDGDPVTVPSDKAVIISGSMELIGGGAGSDYTFMRYALGFTDSLELVDQYTDSARWVSVADSAKNANKTNGYLFTPVSGTGTMSNSWRGENGGAGTVWRVNYGDWVSTNNPNSPQIAAVRQAPRNAEMVAGVYKWAISIQDMGDGTNEVRWYMVEENDAYWFGGTVIDEAQITNKVNGVMFGFNGGEYTRVDFWNVKIDKGEPITVPEAPWQAYKVDQWGFSGGNLGGWDLTPSIVGEVSIGGTAAPTGWVTLRGGFDPFELNDEYALKVSGQIELVGGGFDNAGSLRFGLFYSDSAGTTWQDSTLDSNWVWRGTDNYHSGYLITPPSGSNVATWSNGKGTWGSIANGKWWDISASTAHALGNPVQDPASGPAGAGMYDFTISVSKGTGGDMIVFTISKTDGTYYFAHTTTSPVTSVVEKINSIGFAINNTTATAMNLYEVTVDRGEHFDGVDTKTADVPKIYALKQNYPNPFNPTTNIRFDLPKDSDVNLVVYDLMGREVAKLVNNRLNAGYYTINFNAANLPSGVYIYRLKAGDFVSTKKLMLLK